MPIYRYRAVNEFGRRIKGVVNAESLALAKEKLTGQQKMITHLEETKKIKRERVLPAALLLSFTRSMASLLEAGLPLYDSLVSIEEKYRTSRHHALFLDLCDHLKRGSPLSSALARYPKTFNTIYTSMVAAAEESGALHETFKRLSEMIERSQMLKKRIMSALIYPAFLGGFCLLVTGILLFFVIPTMEELFEGRSIATLTRAVLALSHMLRDMAWPLFFSLNTLLMLVLLAFQRGFAQRVLTPLIPKIPYVKTLLLHAALIRFAHALSLLVRGSVPLLKALQLAREQMGYAQLQKEMERASVDVAEGRSLRFALDCAPHIPKLVVRIVGTSEETGNLPEGLERMAALYEEQLNKSLTQLTTLLQPLLLIILGGIVGLILLSVLLPLTDVSSFLN